MASQGPSCLGSFKEYHHQLIQNKHPFTTATIFTWTTQTKLIFKRNTRRICEVGSSDGSIGETQLSNSLTRHHVGGPFISNVATKLMKFFNEDIALNTFAWVPYVVTIS